MSGTLLTWGLVAAGLVAVGTLVAYTAWSRRSAQRHGERRGHIWKRSYHVGTELAAGRDVQANSARLIELVASVPEPVLVAAALAVVVRQQPAPVPRALQAAVRRTALPAILRGRLRSDDADAVVEALEIAEVLEVHTLLGEAAALTRHPDQLVVRAACDAVVALKPQVGLGILVGLTGSGESWVLDSIGRAIQEINRCGGDVVPLSAAQWRHAPMLAARALVESATFDRATVSDAVAALIACLDDASSAKRLAAINALAVCIDSTAAQLALAGALGSNDRMTRYAAAAVLSDTVVGRQILRCAAGEQNGSDAARMAAEILWTDRPHPDDLELLMS